MASSVRSDLQLKPLDVSVIRGWREHMTNTAWNKIFGSLAFMSAFAGAAGASARQDYEQSIHCVAYYEELSYDHDQKRAMNAVVDGLDWSQTVRDEGKKLGLSSARIDQDIAHLAEQRRTSYRSQKSAFEEDAAHCK
jgi:hypothetical protein